MTSHLLILTLLLAAMLKTTCAIGFEWESEVNVNMPHNEHTAVHLPNGLRRAQATIDMPVTESEALGSTTDASASDASLSTETEAPRTIMVLLPDHLAHSSSGSGSVMYFDGAMGNEDSGKSVGSDPINDDASNAASIQMVTSLTALIVLFTSLMS